ncbi:MAG TPA: toll/interleukin-1 receptor domain-containing protein [Candidatus Angelobacter sp.]|jgi:hypothetical protein|nr:toll/interleukin-1 receptor domain-containing protein [Candidatus Angelobacter sp.]
MTETLDPNRCKNRRLRVFLCHSSEDKPVVRDLYHHLKADGFAPWLDEENLLPGQDWRKEILAAMHACDVVLVCLSEASVKKEGYIQKEIGDALSVAEEKPDGLIFIIPLRIENVRVPSRLEHCQCANLFEQDGYQRLVHALSVRSSGMCITYVPLLADSQECAKLIENDPANFTSDRLVRWRHQRKNGAFAAIEKRSRSPQVAILTPRQVADAYRQMNALNTLDRNGVALAVARSLSHQRGDPSMATADDYVGLVVERVESPLMGGRSGTLGLLLYLIHPEAGYVLDPLIAKRLLTASETALSSDSFLQPETALLIAGFTAERLGAWDSASFDFVGDLAQRQSISPNNPRCVPYAASLIDWLRTNRKYKLRTVFPLSHLIPLIEQPAPSRSIVLADMEGLIMKAISTAKKPLKERAPAEIDEYDLVTRYVANQWMMNLGILSD